MDLKQAKHIGRKRALESVTIGVILFYVIGVFLFSNEGLRSLLWLGYLDLYNWMFIANWVITFYVLSVFVGNYAGKEILVEQRNPLTIGIKSGVIMIFLGAFFGCFLGFLTEGLESVGTNDNPFVDYFLKPIYWIVLFGIVPGMLVGIFFGWRIKHSK